MNSCFWQGFYKKSEVLADYEKSKSESESTKVAPPYGQRSISVQGPQLAELTMHSDNERFEGWKPFGG